VGGKLSSLKQQYKALELDDHALLLHLERVTFANQRVGTLRMVRNKMLEGLDEMERSNRISRIVHRRA
jgi:hypothetical protein